MVTTTTVHVRVKSVSNAVRRWLVRLAMEPALPFNVQVPNAETITMIQELETRRRVRFEGIEVLMADLNAKP